MDHTRFAARPALAVVQHDAVVPGRGRLPDEDADIRVAPLADHVAAPALRGVDAPGAADPSDAGDLDMVLRPPRISRREALPLRRAAVPHLKQLEIRPRQLVTQE